MIRIIRISILVGVFFSVQIGFAQVTSTTVGFNKDTYIRSNYPTSNYGTGSGFYAYYNITPYSIRSLFQADLSSIPTHAIILSADMELYSNWGVSTYSHPMYLSRVSSTWAETGVTWNTQPSWYTSGQISVPHADVDANGWSLIDVTSHVQYMVNYPSLNNGWILRLQSETGQSRGRLFRSREYTTGYTPKITIDYVLPIEIEATVTHSDNGQDNGVIDNINITEGSGTYTSYTWIQFDAGATTTIESGSNIANADISGLEPGLYLLTVTDDEGTSNYKYFLVGEYGQQTDVCIYANDQPTAAMYNEDAFLQASNPDVNYGSSNDIQSHSGSVVRASLMKYQLDFDPTLTFTTADLYVYSATHYRASLTCSNEAFFQRLTEQWYENIVTWNNRPAATTTDQQIATETAVGYHSQNDIMNILDFVSYWQANPTENFGLQMTVDIAEPQTTRRYYGSSDRTSIRPKLCLSYYVRDHIYATPFKELRGGYYKVPLDDKLRFEFFEEYNKSGDLDYAILDNEGVDVSGSLDALTEEFGDNRFILDVSSLASGYYVMEITNAKNEKWYFRFKMD